jgi:transcriptional antiterminator RfaH
MDWYLILAKPKQEKVALVNLQQQGYECYLPLIKLEKLRRQKLRLVEEALFPRYLFIHLNTSSSGQSWAPIRSTLGVSQMVRFGNEYAKVDAKVIEFLQFHDQERDASPQHLFQPGESVLITQGPFSGLNGIYQLTDADKRVMILIELLNKPVQLHIDPSALQKDG